MNVNITALVVKVKNTSAVKRAAGENDYGELILQMCNKEKEEEVSVVEVIKWNWYDTEFDVGRSGVCNVIQKINQRTIK